MNAKRTREFRTKLYGKMIEKGGELLISSHPEGGLLLDRLAASFGKLEGTEVGSSL